MMERLESFDSSDLMEFITAPQVKLVGTGGAGNNILNRLFSRRVKGVETIALNTDANHLNQCKAHVRKVIGAKVTNGRGAGGDPYIGKRCAEEDEEAIRSRLSDGDIVFVIAGMGGGTGTGSAPVIAQYAKETDAVVVGVAILPFREEGLSRRKVALEGLVELKRNCDCVIELDNEKLNELTDGDYPIQKAFSVMSDLVSGIVQSLSEVVTEPSMINVDFADLRKIIEAGGTAKVLYGESDGSDPGSVLDSVLGNPLLGNKYKGAEAVLLHIAAGSEFAMSDCHEVLSALKYDLAEDANLIWGLRTDDSMSTKVKVVMLVSAIPDSEHDLNTEAEEELNSLGSSLPMIN